MSADNLILEWRQGTYDAIDASVTALRRIELEAAEATTLDKVMTARFAARTIHECISMVMAEIQEKKDQTNE